MDYLPAAGRPTIWREHINWGGAVYRFGYDDGDDAFRFDCVPHFHADPITYDVLVVNICFEGLDSTVTLVVDSDRLARWIRNIRAYMKEHGMYWFGVQTIGSIHLGCSGVDSSHEHGNIPPFNG